MMQEDRMALALLYNGPFVATINAKPAAFYSSGIDDPDECDPEELNHSVLIVGFGVDSNSTEYWLIKNSWGADWGEDGYYKLIKGRDACGIARLTQTLVVAQDDSAISAPTKDLGNLQIDDGKLDDDDHIKIPW